MVAQIHNISGFENCQTTLLQTEQIINGQNVASASLGEIQTILNLKRVYQYVTRHISDGLSVNIQLLKKINSIVAQDDSLAPGDFRTGTVGVTLVDGSRHRPPVMSDVDVQNLFVRIENSSHSTTETTIRSMLAFMRQQIFGDCNKRTATLFANAMLIEKSCGVLEISELQMPYFRLKLLDFYRTGDDTNVATYLYQNCIFGIDY